MVRMKSRSSAETTVALANQDKSTQQSIQDVAQAQWDVVVVGAGPAGSVVAAYLAAKGHSTLLMDGQAFPREKVCGDGLNHDAIGFLKQIGLFETVKSQGHRSHLARVYSKTRVILEIPGPYITWKRKYFDNLLVQRAVDSGVTFCLGKAIRITNATNHTSEIYVDGLCKPLKSRYTVLATGARIALAKALRLSNQAMPSAVAARCYVQSKENLECLAAFYSRSLMPGYGWIFPLGNGLYNVGVIAFHTTGRRRHANLRRLFKSFLTEFPLGRKVVNRGKIIGDLAAAPLRCGLPRDMVPGVGNLIATGETIGSTFNITGEGIGKAMETGALAARVIHQAIGHGQHDIVSRYTRALDQKFRGKYDGYLAAERWLAKPWLSELMARRVMGNAYLKQGVIDMITRETDPRRLFPLRRVFKSIWG